MFSINLILWVVIWVATFSCGWHQIVSTFPLGIRLLGFYNSSSSSVFTSWCSCSPLGARVHFPVLVFTPWCSCSPPGARVHPRVLVFTPWCSCSPPGARVHLLVLVFTSRCSCSLPGARVHFPVQLMQPYHQLWCRCCSKSPKNIMITMMYT